MQEFPKLSTIETPIKKKGLVMVEVTIPMGQQGYLDLIKGLTELCPGDLWVIPRGMRFNLLNTEEEFELP